MDLEFSIAESTDDLAIRNLLADTPMPGAVTVSFQREPNYFIGESIMGERCITLKAVDRANGALAAIICLASAKRFIKGTSQAVGYIGQLRITEAYQGYMIPLRSVSFIKEIIKDGWPDTWFVVFADENPEALSIFVERPRSSMPSMKRVTGITTSAILTSAKMRRSDGNLAPETRLCSGVQIDIKKIVQFLSEEGKKREFFPNYDVNDFNKHGGTLACRFPCFNPSDFIVAEDGNGIAGVCAVWDQSPFKQAVVKGYRGMLGRVRPLYNLAAPFISAKPLPEVGTQIRSSYLSAFAVRNNNVAIARALIERSVQRARGAGKDYLMVGLADSDELMHEVKRYRRITYRSVMYAFRFDGHMPSFNSDTTPYVEIATL